jgi:hypothetical protein
VIRRLVGALALVAIGIPVPVAATPAQPTSSADGPCTDNVGITVVIDFQELGGGVNVRCANEPVTSGLDALDKAGIVWQGTLRFPGVVCRIAGQPGADTEACGNTPPLSAYWSYWVAPRGGQWCFSNLGAGNRKPPAGAVEGWSFAFHRSAVDTPPPGFAPPPPIDGQAPNPLNRADCGTASNPPPTPTTAAPTTTPEPASTVTVPQPPTTDAASEVPVAPSAPTTTVRPAAGAAATTPSTTTPVSIVVTSVAATTTEPATDAVESIVPDNAAALGATSTSVVSVDSTVELGTVDLGDDGRGGGGFGVATVIGIIVAGSLIAAGVWAARRRRQMVRGPR